MGVRLGVYRGPVAISRTGRTEAGGAADAGEQTSRGVEGNARLTGLTAAVLLVLLAAEGATVLRIRPLLTPHVFIGMLLVPPVALKMATTGYRFARYYLGAAGYRRKGPPPALLRLLGPLLVVLTVILFASGIGLLFASPGLRPDFSLAHKASFVLWFGAMTVHVLGHLRDTARLAPSDFSGRTRSQVAGAGLRQWTLVASLGLGLVLAGVFLGRVGPYLAHGR